MRSRRFARAAARPRDRQQDPCQRCGDCCHYQVVLDQQDLDRITAYLGIPAHGITEINANRHLVIRRIAGRCLFLRRHRNRTHCAIYPARPETCCAFPRPGVNSCDRNR